MNAYTEVDVRKLVSFKRYQASISEGVLSILKGSCNRSHSEIE